MVAEFKEADSRNIVAILIAATIAGRSPAASREADVAIFDGAFRDAQMAVSARAALALSRGAARLAAADPVVATLIRARQDAADRIAAAEVGEAAARAVPDGVVAEAVAALSAARADFAAADRALAVRAPGYRAAIGIAPVSVADARALLRRDEAIVLIAPAEDATYVFALTARRQGWRRVPIDAAALGDEVVRLRATLDPGGAGRGGEDAAPEAMRPRTGGFDRATAHRLYRALWHPLASLLGGARTVYVVAGGALGELPLAALVTRLPGGRDDDAAAQRRTAWLVRRHALVTLPGIGSLRALRAAGAVPAGRGFAGFGDPLLPAAGALPPLPGTAAELRALAEAAGDPKPAIALGMAATERAVRAAPLEDRRVLAFATHGLVAGEAGAEPALAFTPPAIPDSTDDGYLTASEAATLRLSADWVILSACNSAAGDGRDPGATGGEALSGLASGFFAAGARAVLVSHWRVRDDGAGLLTTATLRAWSRDPRAGRAAALRRAMLAMIDDRAHPERADPAWWAPFVLAGDGR